MHADIPGHFHNYNTQILRHYDSICPTLFVIISIKIDIYMIRLCMTS